MRRRGAQVKVANGGEERKNDATFAKLLEWGMPPRQRIIQTTMCVLCMYINGTFYDALTVRCIKQHQRCFGAVEHPHAVGVVAPRRSDRGHVCMY